MFQRLRQVAEFSKFISIGNTGARPVRVLGRTSLTATHSIHVVETAGERLVIACHPGGCTVLSRSGEKHDESA
jgi:flagellar biogenesis protein FliO